MSEWWTYRPSDFLLFSPRVYWRQFELLNAAVWPAQLATVAIGLALVALVLRPGAARFVRPALAALGLLWAVTAYGYFWTRYATINWAAPYAAAVFAAQAAALLAAAALGRRPAPLPDVVTKTGATALVLWGVALHPLLAALEGRRWTSAEVFGLAPDPTAIATLGVLALLPRGAQFALGLAPILWLMASAATLGVMGSAQAAVPLAAAVFGLLLILRPDRL